MLEQDELVGIAVNQLLKQSTHFVIIAADLEGTIFIFNKGAEEILGYGAGEVIGKLHLTDLLTDAHVQYRRDILTNLIGTPVDTGNLFGAYITQASSTPQEWAFCGREGGEVLVILTITELAGTENTPVGFLVTGIESAQIKVKTSQDAEEKERLQYLLDSAPVGIGISTDGLVRYANPRLREMIKVAVGDPSPDLYVDPIERDRVTARIANGSGLIHEEMKMFGPTGDIRDMSIDFLPTEFEGVPGVLVWMLDVTGRNQIEEEIRQSRSHLATVLDSLPDAAFAIDRDGIVTAWNHASEILSGVKAVDVIGKGNFEYSALFYGERRPILVDLLGYGDDELAKKYTEVYREGDVLSGEAEISPQGNTLYVQGLACPLRDADGNIIGGVEMIHDLTERKRLEQDLEVARQAAEQASRAKSDFLANMSHEIRTPMNAIIGMAHLTLKTELDFRQRDYVEKIQRAGQHLLGIINDILDFSKVEAGKLEIESTEVDLEWVMSSVANLVAEKAQAKGLELVCRINGSVPKDLIGDPLRLSQILTNYVNNAVKFTEEGEIGISVNLIEDTDTSVLLRFEVTDTGIGLTESQKLQMFQDFQQADTSTTRKYGGTGLGLAISKRLAELMNGQVGVESAPGEGSTFWFTAQLAKSNVRKHLLPHPDLRGRRMLVVDDNESAREVLAEILSELTFEVVAVGSGPAGIRAVAEGIATGKPFEVIFLDWMMPVMDGLETAAELRRSSLELKPHLVMVTGYGREEGLKNAVEVGIEEVLVKPVTSSVVFESVMRVLAPESDHQTSEREFSGRWIPGAISDDLEVASRGGNLLLVEDNELNQQVASELLADAGFTVEIAANGTQAVERVKQDSFQAILMDMQMPVMDGLTATRLIRDLGITTPIIAMTANALQADRDACAAAGMDDYLAKPIDPEALISTLDRWINPDNTQVVVEHELGTVSGNFPTGIEGFDGPSGLKHAGGKVQLYRDLLEKFVASQAGALSAIWSALDQNDWATGERLAHTLKGTASTIGANSFSELVGKVESGIREGASLESISTILDDLRSPFEKLIEELGSWISRAPIALTTRVSTTLQNPVDIKESSEIRAQLIDLLASNDAQAEEILQLNEDLLRVAFPADYTQIANHVRSFDYDKALSILNQTHSSVDIKVKSGLSDG